ncbi:MAG: bifunctional glutamate N-acetyltransferase/amino-acid acetyltransferase ArgJ [Thermodesulfovibrionia bacterium]
MKRGIIIPGFRFSGISAGIKPNGAKDLALIYSEDVATIAGVFTTNRIKSAPVRLDMDRVSSGKGQAIIINSGNANACTGERGLKDAIAMTEAVAKSLNIRHEHVYVSSTGIIGMPLPIERIKKAIPDAVRNLSPYAINDSAFAIMTTDTFPKITARRIRLGEKTGIIAGIAKGAGMICPTMATMLCFLFTDISIEHDALNTALKEAVDMSFNRLIIDNDTSTNDTVLIMANGRLNNREITKGSIHYPRFKKALCDVTSELSRMIAIDGEGATKVIKVIVNGAKTGLDAERVARSIATSMLVKTAIYGSDPNWGRVMAAIGYSGVDVIEERIDIYIGKCKVVENGIGTKKERLASRILKKNDVSITVDLGLGNKGATVLTTDLTEEYVRVNSRYST